VIRCANMLLNTLTDRIHERDGWTDGRTPYDNIGRPCIASRSKNVQIIVLPSQQLRGTLQSLYAKLLYSSTQTLDGGLNRLRQVSRTTDEKGETFSPSVRNVTGEEQARVSDGRLFHVRAAASDDMPPERHGRQG